MRHHYKWQNMTVSNLSTKYFYCSDDRYFRLAGSAGKISVGAVLTSYLCFSQLIKPLEELHRILDELSESLILAEDFFKMADIPHDFSYTEISEVSSPKKDSPI